MDEISILYPAPPPYYKVFTEKNVAKLNQLKQEQSLDELRSNEEVESSNMKYLIPPLVPSQEVYHSFGNIWQFKDKFMSLNDAGIQQLYPDSTTVNDEEEDIFTIERIKELKKLTKSLLLNFLELIGLLVKNPYYINEKIEQTRVILINLHHLLNSYRLHQSREDLILRIEDKITSTLEEVEEINKTVATIEQKFEGLVEKLGKFENTNLNNDSIELVPQESDQDNREALIQDILKD